MRDYWKFRTKALTYNVENGNIDTGTYKVYYITVGYKNMKIIAKSKALSKTDLYKLLSPSEYTNMGEKVGETLQIEQFVIHQEDDMYNGVKKVLSIETTEGEIVVSASKSLVSEFEKLVVIFGANAVKEIVIVESQTGMGRDVLSCRYAALA